MSLPMTSLVSPNDSGATGSSFTSMSAMHTPVAGPESVCTTELVGPGASSVSTIRASLASWSAVSAPPVPVLSESVVVPIKVVGRSAVGVSPVPSRAAVSSSAARAVCAGVARETSFLRAVRYCGGLSALAAHAVASCAACCGGASAAVALPCVVVAASRWTPGASTYPKYSFVG